ncbi:cell growth regulator with RING finger domain protein 1 [Trichomycterus rosablanca]|uniref:cell growth regulator with RING finger domain protein 1 n=1 Tax=Trichomycterus rosablanca TaxID=2290929 RepID=UPI002F3564D6
MAAEFIVKLYEYSPLFYISLISVCFILTVTLLLSWFGFDVPVMVRSSDEGDSLPPAPEKKMVQVPNPFALELGTTPPGTVKDGVCLRTCCLEECVLTCFWGCSVQALQAALHTHRSGDALNSAASFQRALHGHYRHAQTFTVGREERGECVTHIPPQLGVTDFGFLPRSCYPLVAVLTLAKSDDRDAYNIVASVTVLHVPDDRYTLSGRVLFHYLLTAAGNLYDLKPLFMSTDGTSPAPTAESEEELHTEAPETGEAEPEEEGAWQGAAERDCVVCQNAAVNRVLLPCRHACVCDECVVHFQHCPMCRTFICESFTLSTLS